MTASKETARRALELFHQLVPGHFGEEQTELDRQFVEEFLLAAERKLPREETIQKGYDKLKTPEMRVKRKKARAKKGK